MIPFLNIHTQTANFTSTVAAFRKFVVSKALLFLLAFSITDLQPSKKAS